MGKLLPLLLITASVMAAAQKIAGGPFVVNVTPRTATVVWIVQDDALAVHAPAGVAPRISPALHVEKTTLTGLQPNTRYDYDIPGQEGVKGSFQTPPNGAGAFHFVVYGDNRTRDDVHRKVIATLLQSGIPDFVLQTGDMVPDGNDTAYWPVFFDIERELLRQTVFFPALGNHERDCRNFYDFFSLAKPYYSFNWGNAHFTVLNSDLANSAPTKSERDAFWAEQTRWLEEDLQASQNAEYRFVTAHHPPFTAVARRQGDNPQMTALVPMFEKYKVTAAFFGHDHNYQRYLKNGIHYIVSGGGGAPLYDVDKPDPAIAQKVVSVENFVTVAVDGKAIRIQAIDITGKTIDELEIRH
ncbi:MAG TPA: metallophosphoesterase [Bryobacteraceae bacterium]|nr:metallophosphoesterase [Bryobacteraceae bacterium]